MTKVEYKHFREMPKFKKIFVFKGFAEDFVHYLPHFQSEVSEKRTKLGFAKVPLRSVELRAKKETALLEKQLLAIAYEDVLGDKDVDAANRLKFMKALKPHLIPWKTA